MLKESDLVNWYHQRIDAIYPISCKGQYRIVSTFESPCFKLKRTKLICIKCGKKAHLFLDLLENLNEVFWDSYGCRTRFSPVSPEDKAIYPFLEYEYDLTGHQMNDLEKMLRLAYRAGVDSVSKNE